MDVRVMIVSHPNHVYQVGILAPEPVLRSWSKTYDSKLSCVTELKILDLLTPDEADETLGSDFDIKDRILIARSETDPVTLEEAGFLELKPDVVN
jgi:hypothetical protein